MTCVLAVTTYNRIHRLQRLLESFRETYDRSKKWVVIIADDGSNDGTLEYIKLLKWETIDIHLIRNYRQGIHHQTNSIFKYLENLDFDVCFKCDDDIEFLQKGWDQLYIEAIEQSGYDHLCYCNTSWRKRELLPQPIVNGELIARVEPRSVQGAFYTITPRVLRDVGFMDTENFGFRGMGHIDYTYRACRAGFNHPDHPFDVVGSEANIGMNLKSYESALSEDELSLFENDAETKRKLSIMMDPTRCYIPYEEGKSLDSLNLKPLFTAQYQELKNTVEWYETNYGHQPKWFVRIGKLMFNPSAISEKIKRIYEVSFKGIFKEL